MYVIAREEFDKIVEDIRESTPVIAPTLLSSGDLIYRYVDNAGEVSLKTSAMPILSAKEFFLAREEELFRFCKTSDDIEMIAPEEPGPQTFIGIRSCDLTGVRFLEKFFRETFHDATVTRKIENTTFISLGCNTPSPTCFCVCCDGGPFLVKGTDAQIIDLGDRVFCEIMTPKGEKLFEPYRKSLQPAKDEDKKAREDLIKSVDKKFQRRSYMSMGVKRVSTNSVPQEIWETLGNRCIGCGSCTYVCPTCSCFTVCDHGTENAGARVRTWDSCNYSGFTREVSGHNPRPSAADRLKRRFFHKLSYQCLNSNGRLGCVGCGRCVISCPGQADISTLVTALRKPKAEKCDG